MVDPRGPEMGETPNTEHKVICATWKGFLMQSANDIIARNGVDIRLWGTKMEKMNKTETKNFTTHNRTKNLHKMI